MPINKEKISSQIKDKFIIENETFKRAVKSDPRDKIEIEIGDSKQPDFQPQAKIMRWNNEVNFSLRWKHDHLSEEPTLETVGKEIRFKKGKQSFQAYELDPSNLGEDGGLEIEIVLDEKPASNIFEFTLQTKELDFFYQPPLTQKQLDEGKFRPDNVIGSYAVYHRSKGRMNRADGLEYKTGKAFHIYRPKAIDKNGLEVWCTLEIDKVNGLLKVIVPQEFLEKAQYPVKVDPTFGNTSVGGSGLFFALNDIYGNVFTAPDTGTVQSHTFQVYQNPSGGNAKAILALNSTLNIVTNGVGNAVAFTTQAWYTSSFGTNPSITNGTNYVLAVIGSVNMQFRYDTTGGTSKKDTSNSYATPTNPTDASSDDDLMSIYATYTASGTTTSTTTSTTTTSTSSSSSSSTSTTTTSTSSSTSTTTTSSSTSTTTISTSSSTTTTSTSTSTSTTTTSTSTSTSTTTTSTSSSTTTTSTSTSTTTTSTSTSTSTSTTTTSTSTSTTTTSTSTSITTSTTTTTTSTSTSTTTTSTSTSITTSTSTTTTQSLTTSTSTSTTTTSTSTSTSSSTTTTSTSTSTSTTTTSTSTSTTTTSTSTSTSSSTTTTSTSSSTTISTSTSTTTTSTSTSTTISTTTSTSISTSTTTSTSSSSSTSTSTTITIPLTFTVDSPWVT